MPVFNVTTNVDLEGVDTQRIFTKATSAIASILGRPERFVMVVLKGSVPISFEGNKDPAAFTQLLSMGGIDSTVKKNLISTLGAILDTHLSIPTTRFFCHVVDVTAAYPHSKL